MALEKKIGNSLSTSAMILLAWKQVLGKVTAMKKFALLLLILTLIVPATSFAQTERPKVFKTPQAVVAWLYRDHGTPALQSMDGDYAAFEGASKPIVDQPKSVLARYFTPKLVDLMLADRRMAARGAHMTILSGSDFLTQSQDFLKSETIRFDRLPKSTTVRVTFLTSDLKVVQTIDWHTAKVGRGYLISDMTNRDWTLVKNLTSQKNRGY